MDNEKEVYNVLLEQVENNKKNIQQIANEHTNEERSTKKEKIREAGIKEYIRYWFSTKKGEMLIAIIYGITIFSLIVMLINYGKTVYFLSDDYMNITVVRAALGIMIPLVAWIISTNYAFWNYKRQKFFGLYVMILNILLYLMYFLLEIALKLFLP